MKPYQTRHTTNKFCPFCGKENRLINNYCDECGYKIPEVSCSTTRDIQPQSDQNFQSQKIIPSSIVEHKKHAKIVITQKKSYGKALVLTCLFGPIGLFYSSVIGGFVMTFIPIVLFIIGLTEYGLFIGLVTVLFLPFLLLWFILHWVVCLIWTVLAVSIYNKNVLVAQYYER